MKNEPIKHDKQFPPVASAGSDNAYYLKGCDTVQRSPAYASCLFKVSEWEAGRTNALHRECHEAMSMGGGKCQALHMRQEETLAGEALYFFPRRPPQALLVPVEGAGEFGVRISNLTPPHLIPKDPKPKGRFNASANKSVVTNKPTALDRELLAAGEGYVAAINAAMAETPPVDMTVEVKRVIATTAAHAETPPPAPQVAPTARPPMQVGESPLQYARRIAATRI